MEILNSRERNMKIFEEIVEIVENIKSIGLKNPIVVTEPPATMANRSTCRSATKGA